MLYGHSGNSSEIGPFVGCWECINQRTYPLRADED